MKNTYYKVSKDFSVRIIPNLAKYYKVSVWINIILLIIVLILLAKPDSILIKHKHTRDTIRVGDVHLSDTGIARELVKHECVLPAVAIAQARIETGNYTSRVCLANKNLFGIKFHKCKYVLGTNLNHASYKSYRDNIKCYIHIQNRYLRNIDGKYAEAKNYISVVKSVK
jgi:uncharacterized FlgJ-related protein